MSEKKGITKNMNINLSSYIGTETLYTSHYRNALLSMSVGVALLILCVFVTSIPSSSSPNTGDDRCGRNGIIFSVFCGLAGVSMLLHSFIMMIKCTMDYYNMIKSFENTKFPSKPLTKILNYNNRIGVNWIIPAIVLYSFSVITLIIFSIWFIICNTYVSIFFKE